MIKFIKKLFNFTNKQQRNIPAIIQNYSNKNIFIEILADGYKLKDVDICWRGYVYWKQNNKWIKEDCGCLPDWEDTFNLCVNFIHDYILYKK